MRQSRCRLIDYVLDNPVKKLRHTARKVEHLRTQHLQRQRETTNPYHKEQYVTAFVEAQSAAAVHKHAVEAKSDRHSSTPASLTTSTELTQLAHELEVTYGDSQRQSSLARVPDHKKALTSPTATSTSNAVVEFGAWRSPDGGDVRLAARIRSIDVMRHCVIREARTPPELSPEVIERRLPTRVPPPARTLLTFIQSRSFRAATKPIDAERLENDVVAALRSLRHAPEVQKNVALYAVFSVSRFRDWSMASTLVLWLRQQWPLLVEGATTESSDMSSTCMTDVSHFVALLCDTTRSAAPLQTTPPPSLEELEAFCRAFHFHHHDRCPDGESINDESLPCNGPLWDPVVSAPLLSLIGLDAERDSRTKPAVELLMQLERVVDRYCVRHALPMSYRHAKKSAQPLAYMPAIAWAEYLRARHRCGASLAELQAATDRITDPNKTRHATELLSNTHVWNAYLSCSPGPHAMEVYEKNLRPYHVAETPATVAAVMTALIESEGTAKGAAQARALWERLLKTSSDKKMISRTSSTLVAYAKLLVLEGNAEALSKLLTSYDDLYECFGVPVEWFGKEQQRALKNDVSDGTDQKIKAGLRLLHRVCAAHPLLIPPLVQKTLLDATRQVTDERRVRLEKKREERESSIASAAAGVSMAEVPEITPEDLAAML
uniref:Uncharacterized protein n=1 Tax=Angomonas deanei TaxID=59799 RepID=C6K3U3_9TRYP|nr:conserved hypothetical protein [Angomonas deanei]